MGDPLSTSATGRPFGVKYSSAMDAMTLFFLVTFLYIDLSEHGRHCNHPPGQIVQSRKSHKKRIMKKQSNDFLERLLWSPFLHDADKTILAHYNRLFLLIPTIY